MATRTEILGLVKPGLEDDADIRVINANMDILDKQIGEVNIVQKYKASWFDSVVAMKAEPSLTAGAYVNTAGYYSPNDGGGASYIIRAKVESDIDDGGSIHELSNGLVAELIIENGTVCPEQFGAVGDGINNDTEALRQAFNHGTTVLLKNRYLITSEISITNDCIIISNANGELLFNSFGALFRLERPIVLYKVKATSLNDERVSETVIVNFCNSNYKQVIAYNCDINNFSSAFWEVGDNSIISGCNIVLKEVVNEAKDTFYGIHGECSNSSYINNIIKNGRHSIYLSDKCENVRVIGNVCMNSNWQNIHIYNLSNTRKSKDCIIADNTVINNGSSECIIVVGYSENILISNNICTNTGSGYCIKVEGAANTISLDVFIKSNVLRGKKGIYIYYSKGVIVSENDIKVDGLPVFCETFSNNIVCKGNITQSLENSVYHYWFANVNNIEFYNNILEGLTTDKYYVDDFTSCGLKLENVESGKFFDNKVNGYNVYSIKHPTANLWYTIKEGILFDETNDPPQVRHNVGDVYKYTHSSTKYLTKCISSGTPGTFVTISI